VAALGPRAANRSLANFKLCMPIVGGSTPPQPVIRQSAADRQQCQLVK
jgi:hypothetical protein